MIVKKTTNIHLYPTKYDIISIKALARVPLVPLKCVVKINKISCLQYKRNVERRTGFSNL